MEVEVVNWEHPEKKKHDRETNPTGMTTKLKERESNKHQPFRKNRKKNNGVNIPRDKTS